MKVLIVDDDAVSRKVLEVRLAEWGYEGEAVEGGSPVEEMLSAEDAPRIVALAWPTSWVDGRDLLRRVKATDGQPRPYVLLLMENERRGDIAAGLDEGADDYIVKPFNPQEFAARLRAGKRIVNLQAELKESREALQYQATHDPLTGLWNRGEGTAVLERELQRMRREEGAVAVALIDLDHFKHVNDTYGHAVGDTLLKGSAQRMLGSLRPYDTVCRYGNEEFFIVLPNNGRDQAMVLAERIRLRLRESPIETQAGDVFVTASIGVAIGGAGEGLDVDALLTAAAAALSRAKQCGRDQIQIAGEADYRRVVGAS